MSIIVVLSLQFKQTLMVFYSRNVCTNSS